MTSQWPANHNTQCLLSQYVRQQSRQVWDFFPFFFCCSVKIKLLNVEFESPDFNFDHKHFGKHRGDHMTPEAGSQSANQPISFSFTSVGPPLSLLVGRAFYTPNTEADTWTSREEITDASTETVITHSWISAEVLKVSVCRLHANGGTVLQKFPSKSDTPDQPDLRIQGGFSLTNSCEVLSNFYQSTSCF